MKAKNSTTLHVDLKITVLFEAEGFSETQKDRLYTIFKKKTGAKEPLIRPWHISDIETAGTHGKKSQYVVVMPDLRREASAIISQWTTQYYSTTFIVLDHPVEESIKALAHEHRKEIVKL